jgi:putative hydrolase of the HAD superfamily
MDHPLLWFDLDETLLVEETSVAGAFRAAGAVVTAHCPGISPEQFHRAARPLISRAWHARADYPWFGGIGGSSWEALVAEFLGNYPALRRAREAAPAWRAAVWLDALAAVGAPRDPALAAAVAAAYAAARAIRHVPFADSHATLAALGARFPLGLLTNGLPCHQRSKLAGGGLSGYFQAVVVSGDLGLGKPDRRLFAHAEALLPGAGQRWIIGDNPVNDIAGGAAAGWRTVWLNRQGAPPPPDLRADHIITSLTELPPLLGV